MMNQNEQSKDQINHSYPNDTSFDGSHALEEVTKYSNDVISPELEDKSANVFLSEVQK